MTCKDCKKGKKMREILFRGRDISGQWHYGVPLMLNEDYVRIAKLNEHRAFNLVGKCGKGIDCEVIGNIHDNPELLEVEE